MLCGGAGGQAERCAGQDDSALHGRHLPPSPRKRVSTGGLADALFILPEEGGGKAPRADGPSGRPASPPGLRALLGSPEIPPTRSGATDAHETLSPVSEDPPSPGLGRPPSTSVPWEREGGGAQGAPEGAAPLQAVGALRHVTSALEQDLRISEENTGGDQA